MGGGVVRADGGGGVGVGSWFALQSDSGLAVKFTELFFNGSPFQDRRWKLREGTRAD